MRLRFLVKIIVIVQHANAAIQYAPMEHVLSLLVMFVDKDLGALVTKIVHGVKEDQPGDKLFSWVKKISVWLNNTTSKTRLIQQPNTLMFDLLLCILPLRNVQQLLY